MRGVGIVSKTVAQNPVAILFVIVLFASLQSGCCRFHSTETQKEDRAAREWLRSWPGKYDWTEFAGWSIVAKSSNSVGESLLHDTSWVRLTEAQSLSLIGQSARPSSARGTPYLLRAVGNLRGELPLAVFVRADGTVWVGGEAISRCSVPLQRRAVVVWLDQPPREVYVTFVVAR